jgi:hypothetical protein
MKLWIFGKRAPEKRPRIRRREPEPEASGDFRGRYGFGRRAHRPDPTAIYEFAPDRKGTGSGPRQFKRSRP